MNVEEGTSYYYGKEEIKEYLENSFKKDSSILDVGCGNGTYYELLKDYFRNIDGVEVYKPNIDRYRLKEKYRNIYNKDIREFKYEWYDIIIFGDVLEHLEIKEAQRVLKYAIKRCREIIVAVPYLYVQGEVGGNVYEVHKQDDLTEDIMQERYPELELYWGNAVYGYYVKKKR